MADLVSQMEKHLRKQYKNAQKDVEKKLKQYFRKFKKLDAQKQKAVKAGTLTQEEYETWRRNKLLYGAHWEHLKENIAEDLFRVNEMAVKYINGQIPDIFVNAYNHLETDIPKYAMDGYSFELVNSDTVAQLAKAGEIMLPPPKDLNKYKDKQWNKKNVNSAVLQGILQGESMDAIAERVAKSTKEKNLAVAMRNGRTMVTAAENSGRAEGIKRAEKDGVILNKIWRAANDSRTRDSHAAMNGEQVPSEKPFSNGLMFPGDWNTNNPAEVYNCRCTLITKFVGFDNKRYKTSERYGENVKAKKEILAEIETQSKWKLMEWHKELYKLLDDDPDAVVSYLAYSARFEDYQILNDARINGTLIDYVDKYIESQSELIDVGGKLEYYYNVDYRGVEYLHKIMNVSNEELEQIAKHYTMTTESWDLNNKLRKGEQLTKEEQKTFDFLSSAIKKNKLTQNTILTRNVGASFTKNAFDLDDSALDAALDDWSSGRFILNSKLRGAVITEDSFVSTSGDPKQNVFSRKKVQLKLLAPEGTEAYIPDNPSESEIILPYKTQYEILEFERFVKDEKKLKETLSKLGIPTDPLDIDQIPDSYKSLVGLRITAKIRR